MDYMIRHEAFKLGSCLDLWKAAFSRYMHSRSGLKISVYTLNKNPSSSNLPTPPLVVVAFLLPLAKVLSAFSRSTDYKVVWCTSFEILILGSWEFLGHSSNHLDCMLCLDWVIGAGRISITLHSSLVVYLIFSPFFSCRLHAIVEPFWVGVSTLFLYVGCFAFWLGPFGGIHERVGQENFIVIRAFLFVQTFFCGHFAIGPWLCFQL